jgi:hypothetical protein
MTPRLSYAILSMGAYNRGYLPVIKDLPGPGMAATADIKTGRRSILSYLVSPIDEARWSAGRER